MKKKIKEKIKKFKDKRKKRKLRVPITLTLLRIVLSPLVLLAILSEKTNIAIILFLFAVLTDFLDGYFAKKRKLRTELGKILDPVADKILINFTLFGLVLKGSLPIWALFVFLCRDILIVLVGWVLIFRKIKKTFKPTTLSRINTFLQILTIVLIFIKSNYFWYALWPTLAFTVISGFDYLFKLRTKPKKIKTKVVPAQKLTKLIKLPDYITMLNVGSGLLSIIFSFNKQFGIAAIFLIGSVVFDYFDGKVARKMRRDEEFGKELDSLADIVSFGVAPAVFGISINQNLTSLILIFVFLCAGILRLARFNITDMEGVYQGMPITFSGVFIPLAYFINVEARFFPYIYLVLAILMISPFRLKKVI